MYGLRSRSKMGKSSKLAVHTSLNPDKISEVVTARRGSNPARMSVRKKHPGRAEIFALPRSTPLPPLFLHFLRSFAAIPIREALLRQHEIADNRSELTAAGDELSKGAPGRTKRIEGFRGKAVFSISSAKIDEFPGELINDLWINWLIDPRNGGYI